MAKILIIEDDAELQQLLSHALFRNGYETHNAFNGQEGYEKILSLRPDLILLDLMLPIIPGTDLIKKVVENTLLRDIPIIVMTAYGDQERILERSLKAQGVREYLQKPFSLQEMISIIKRTLQQNPAANAAPVRQIEKGAVRLDPSYRTLWVNDQMTATLTRKETKLLALLLSSRGAVSRSKLIDGVWGEAGNDNILYKTIQRIREQLGKESARLVTQADGYEFIG